MLEIYNALQYVLVKTNTNLISAFIFNRNRNAVAQNMKRLGVGTSQNEQKLK